MALEQDLVIHTTRFTGIYYEAATLRIVNNIIIIKKGFEWDGCTWARDGVRDENGRPISWKASCVHDALYRDRNNPLARGIADLIFRDELMECGFRFLRAPVWLSAYSYYIGVRAFGWLTSYYFKVT